MNKLLPIFVISILIISGIGTLAINVKNENKESLEPIIDTFYFNKN